MSLIRAFIAVPLPTSLQQQIWRETERLRRDLERGLIRWAVPENIHLTLKFLGDTESDKLDALKVMLAKEMAQLNPFEVAIQKLGVFPNLSRPRVVKIGVTRDENLLTLHKRVLGLASQIGSEAKGKRYSPHLTLGRVKSKGFHAKPRSQIRMMIERYPDVGFGTMRVDSVHLMQSDLTPSGAKYSSLFTAKLGDFFD